MNELPKFKGWTVDARLRQFRKAEIGKPIEFLSFDSELGYQLLREYRNNAPIHTIRFTAEELDWIDRQLSVIPWYDWEARRLGRAIGIKLVQSVQEVIDCLC